MNQDSTEAGALDRAISSLNSQNGKLEADKTEVKTEYELIKATLSKTNDTISSIENSITTLEKE